MTWLFSLIWIPLVVCFALGALLSTAWWMWRRRAVHAEYEKRRLAAEAESDRLRLRVSSLKLSEARADDLQLELEKARTDSTRLPTLERELKELRLQIGLVTELENQIINLRTRADQADRLERQLADLEYQLAGDSDEPAAASVPELEPEAEQAESAEASEPAPEIEPEKGSAPEDAESHVTEPVEADADADVDADIEHDEAQDDAGAVIELRPVIDLDAEPDRIDDHTAGGTEHGSDVIDLVDVSHADDLKIIKGIGPSLESKLNGMGITTWEQLAALTNGQVETVGEVIAVFPGRIKRDNWIEQAALFIERFPLTEPYDRPTKETLKNYR